MIFWLLRAYRRIRARRALSLTVLFLAMIVLLFLNAVCFYVFENPDFSNPDRPAVSFGDALWFSVISIATIGYGDYYPTTTGGRIGSIIFIVLLGLSTFTVYMGLTVDMVTDLILKGQRGMAAITSTKHVVLVHFPGANRVRQIIDEILSDPVHKKREIVIVTDQIDSLPFSLDQVLFVNGSPLEAETYQRAGIERAEMALVLATSYADPNSDAVVASVASVIGRLNKDLYLVAECLEESHRVLFQSSDCNAIVPVLRIAGNLLVQEIHDPGISQMIDVITSNLKGDTLFSSEVDRPDFELTYCEFAKAILDRDVNVLCVIRGEETLTRFRKIRPQKDDRVIYLASKRLQWRELTDLCEGNGQN